MRPNFPKAFSAVANFFFAKAHSWWGDDRSSRAVVEAMPLRFAFICLGLVVALSGCFSRKCGPHQRLETKYDLCACQKGWTLDPATNQCVCEEGSTLDERSGKCKADPPPDEPDAGELADGSAGEDSSTGCPASGLGCVCEDDADCKGYDADYCVIANPAMPDVPRICLFQGCDTGDFDCPKGMKCCAFIFAPKGTACLSEEDPCPFD
jgi:hypothetical protein